MSQIALRNGDEPRTNIGNVAFGRNESGSGLAPQNLGDIVRFAEVMSRADIAIPKHLRDNPGACLAVCMQAFHWQMDPFACAQKSYKVGDQMAYEAQLIAAVINTRAGLKRRPQIEYRGAGQDRQCIVTFEADDGSVHVYESPRFGSITTKNSPLWKSDPDQQLGYYSIRAGARRHFPEVILGVYDRDELEAARDVTPSQPRTSLSDRLAAAKPPVELTGRREGFDAGNVEVGREAIPEAAPAAAATVEVAGNPPTGAEAKEDELPASEGAEDSIGEADVTDASSTPSLIAYARGILTAAGEAGTIEDRVENVKAKHAEMKPTLEAADMDRAVSILKSGDAIARDKADLDAAITHFAGLLGVHEDALWEAA